MVPPCWCRRVTSEGQDREKVGESIALMLQRKHPRRITAKPVRPDKLVWKTNPVDIDTFITSKDYLGQPPLSTRQRLAIVSILGNDPKRIFEDRTLPLESVLAWGKGSGKDLLVSYLVAYVSYVLLCMTDPHAYFGLAYDEPLDIVNIASNAQQARDVFFAKLSSRLRRPCFVALCPSGKPPKVTKQQIIFEHINLRLHSLHSANESWEGLNLLAWVMDEASAFRTEGGADNADKCYSTLRSSADTRFPSHRWIGAVISFPRKQANDFTLDKYKEAKDDPTMFADRAATWEVHPFWDINHPAYREIPFVVLEDLNLRVPETYMKHFLKDPVDARTKYMADPPPQEDGFFDIPQRIYDSVNADIPPLVCTPSVTVRAYDMPGGESVELPFVRMDLDSLPPRDPDAKYFMHGDPGLKKDAFSLAVGHKLSETGVIIDPETGEAREVSKLRIDFVLTWEPRPNTPVDLLNVDDIILTLCRYYGIRRVTFDRWNSASSIQKLLTAGIFAEDLSFSASMQLEMYRNLKMLVYNRLIELPQDEGLVNELVFLKLVNNKVDHDIYGKDRADAVAAVALAATGRQLSKVGQLVQETLGDYYSAPEGPSFAIIPVKVGQ